MLWLVVRGVVRSIGKGLVYVSRVVRNFLHWCEKNRTCWKCQTCVTFIRRLRRHDFLNGFYSASDNMGQAKMNKIGNVVYSGWLIKSPPERKTTWKIFRAVSCYETIWHIKLSTTFSPTFYWSELTECDGTSFLFSLCLLCMEGFHWMTHFIEQLHDPGNRFQTWPTFHSWSHAQTDRKNGFWNSDLHTSLKEFSMKSMS